MKKSPRHLWLLILGLLSLGFYFAQPLALKGSDIVYNYYTYLPITRTQPPLPPALTDLLKNPGFEGITTPGGYTHDTFNGTPYNEILTPEGWISWWVEEPDPWYGLSRPEVRPIPNQPPYSDPPNRIHSGDYAAMHFTVWKPQRAGFYQQISSLPPNSLATFSAYAHSWSCNNDPPPALTCGDPNGFWFKVGIDPQGGTDPQAASVIWSDPFYYRDTYGKAGPLQTWVGDSGTITVFLSGEAKWGVKHNDAYWDDASLIVQPPRVEP